MATPPHTFEQQITRWFRNSNNTVYIYILDCMLMSPAPGKKENHVFDIR